MSDPIEEVKPFLIHPRKGGVAHDRKALFSEWLPSQDVSLAAFLKRKGIHKTSVTKWGGARIWLDARDAFREKAMNKAITSAELSLEKKYEKQLRIVGKLEDVIEKQADKLLTQDRTSHKQSLAEELKTLAEAVHKLSETNLRFRGDDVQKHELTSLNLHAMIVKELNGPTT